MPICVCNDLISHYDHLDGEERAKCRSCHVFIHLNLETKKLLLLLLCLFIPSDMLSLGVSFSFSEDF